MLRKSRHYAIIHFETKKDMKLTEQENRFIKDTCCFFSDDRTVVELNRIRQEMEHPANITVDMVRKARYKMGLKKKPGRGRCDLDEQGQ